MISDIEFIPLVSVMLHRELAFNIYIPIHDSLLDIRIDGELPSLDSVETKEIDGKQYMLISIPLPAAVAARDIIMEITIATSNSTNVKATFTYNTVKYAQLVLADGSDVEKTLVCNILSYIREAYTYFGTSDEAKLTAISELLGDGYNENNAPASDEAVLDIKAPVKSATLVLDATPAIRFYIGDSAAENYAFFINGGRLETVSGTDEELGAYIEMDVYAYQMCYTVELIYTDGETVISGSYNIYSYYEFAKTSGDARLTALCERFIAYCQSAAEYRAQVK